MKKSTWFIVISLLIMIVGSTVFWAAKTREQIATSGQDRVAGETQQTATPPAASRYSPEPPTGHSQNTETIKLRAAAPYTGEATATRSFDGTWFVLTVEADLPDPPAGKVYNIYLVSHSEKEKFFPLKNLTKKNGIYLRTYNSTRDMSAYTEFMITEDSESDSRQNEMAPQVLRGSF